MIFELGLPRKVFTSREDSLKYINLHNGRKTLYQSVFFFKEMNENKPSYESAIIDKLFFDFDFKDGNCWEECNKLHQYLLSDNIKHQLIFSGKGFHLIVYTLLNEFIYPKSTILNVQMFLINKLNLICDMQVIGDLARLRRIPNTYHLKAKRYCVPLPKKVFDKGFEFCKEFALKQNLNDEFIGEKLLDIKCYDFKTKEIDSIIDDNIESSINGEYLKDCDEKIKKLLSKKNLGWKERYLVILYFKERGYTLDEVYKILKENLTPEKFRHCVVNEGQLQYLFDRDDLLFPESCGIKVYK